MNGERISQRTLTIAQAAKYAGVSTKTIYRAIEDGRLMAACLGRSTALRTTPEWVDEWIEASKYTPKPQATPTRKTTRARRSNHKKRQRGFLEA